MSANLLEITKGLRETPEGIWVAAEDDRSQVSFPEGGNEECAQIEDGSYWFCHRNQCIVEIVKRFPPAGTIFEIGGGNGFVCRGLEDAGFSTVLIEPGRAGAEAAKTRGLHSVVCATLEAARFADNSLPAAGMFDVLEHIEQHRQFLAELHRVTAMNGRLYLTVPAYEWLWSDADDYAGHFRRYTFETLSDDLAAAGFEIEYQTYLFASLMAPVFLMRTLPYKLTKRTADSYKDRQPWKEQHNSSGLLSRMLQSVLAQELSWIQAGNTLPVGSSILVVAKKV